jgi:DNA-binding LacI/PurR family transcriptional regulator
MSSAKRPPTIYDVAELSGVSISTISRVLNAPDKVNPETRQRIMDAIDKLGFVPKAEARARALQGTGRIGVLTPFFTAPSFVQRLRGTAAALSKANYELVIYPVDTMEHLRGYLSSIPLMGTVDGLIIMSLFVGDKDAQRLNDSRLETVLIEYPHPKLNSIVIDDFQGGRMAAAHFIRKGYTRIAFIGDIEPPEKNVIHPIRSRFTGFKEALQEAGLTLPQKYVRSVPYTQEDSGAAAHDLLTMAQPPTAIFAASDTQALDVMKAARNLNIKIPQELAVIGFDDIDVAGQVELTTICQHLDESGRLAVQILLGRMNEPNRPLQHIKLPLNLIERATA